MLEGFAPVAAADAEVLLLGTMPSVASLQKGQYYGFGRNAFWPLLYALWDAGEPPADYALRLKFVLSHRWRFGMCCVPASGREARTRQSVRRRPTILPPSPRHTPHIRRVFFNSSGAAALYRRLVVPDPFAHCPQITLPSSSPARAMRFEDKLRLWLVLREALGKTAGKGKRLFFAVSPCAGCG